MPRGARIINTNLPYHVTQRGNNRQTVFLTSADRLEFLTYLRAYARRYHLEVVAYCLMTNHVHLVAIPRHASALSLALGRTFGRYAQRFQLRAGRQGRVWQDRFHARAVGEESLVAVLRYVESNPVRAGLVHQPWEYPWSSASAHCGLSDDSGVLDLSTWFTHWPSAEWQELLARPEEPEELGHLRQVLYE